MRPRTPELLWALSRFLGDNVTIGTHSVVVARHDCSLHIGNGSMLGAGSELLSDIPPYQAWAGNPAHKIKDIPRP